jgi:ectoine hydroxylase-related dioxygenase (phytanoyl-CoA dioxygenase family)
VTRRVSALTGAAAQHRDSMGPDPRVIAGQRPGIVTVWLALTDVTAADSCIYVVPKYADKAFATATREVTWDQFEMQDIRAVPVPAGSVVAWSTHLVHWGSRSTPEATHPRMAITMYLQRADVSPFDASIFDVGANVALDDRLKWVIQALGAHELLRRLFPV